MKSLGTWALWALVLALGCKRTGDGKTESKQPAVAAPQQELPWQRPAGPLRIMPLGDSITAATCTRRYLFEKLSAINAAFDFVGTKHDSGCGDSTSTNFDLDNEGHSCYRTQDVLKPPPASGYPAGGTHPRCNSEDPYTGDASDLERWFATQVPDVVLMHFGTNDVWGGSAPEPILHAYSAIVEKLRTRNPRVKVFVAKIIPLHPSTERDFDALVGALNEEIPCWAASTGTTDSPVVVVDQFQGFDTKTDTRDGVHPNEAGSRKMAERWFAAVRELVVSG